MLSQVKKDIGIEEIAEDREVKKLKKDKNQFF